MAIRYPDGPTMVDEGDSIAEQIRGYVRDVEAHLGHGPWTGQHLTTLLGMLRDAFGHTFTWHEAAANVEVVIRGGASAEFRGAVYGVLRERLSSAMGLSVRCYDEPAPVDPKQTINGVVPAPGGGYYVSRGRWAPPMSPDYYRAAVASRPASMTTATPRPGQTWRSPTGEEGRIYDLTHENYADVWHLRMTSGLRVREEHDDLVTAWSYVSGPTEPETPREAKDRVGALMVADRPEGVTERTWQAVVMAMGEGEDENGMRYACTAARRALVVAERMRVVR